MAESKERNALVRAAYVLSDAACTIAAILAFVGVLDVHGFVTAHPNAAWGFALWMASEVFALSVERKTGEATR